MFATDGVMEKMERAVLNVFSKTWGNARASNTRLIDTQTTTVIMSLETVAGPQRFSREIIDLIIRFLPIVAANLP